MLFICASSKNRHAKQTLRTNEIQLAMINQLNSFAIFTIGAIMTYPHIGHLFRLDTKYSISINE